jgi:pimeloyl-ACP methyl ester carboxylesterase
MPPGAGKKPVVLIIAGSGPTDRDGNQAVAVKAGSYKLLAEALVAEGVASVRYDKRGLGGSTVIGIREADLRFEDFVGDAVQWVKQLRADARFSTVTVVGHSEGSLIGMLAAREGNANAYVSIAGPARPAAAVIRDQLEPQLAVAPPLWENSQLILTSLEGGKIVDPLPDNIAAIPGLASLFRLSVQPYLISWFKYSGATEIARLNMPVLIIQGTTDIQVGVPEAQALAAAKPDAKLMIIEGMNHVLKNAPADRASNIATYTNPSLPLVPDVPKTIAALVKGLR